MAENYLAEAQLAFNLDGLFTTPPLLDSDTPLLLSADSLKQWSRCKKQFFLKTVEGKRWPSNPGNFTLGTQVHQFMDYSSQPQSPWEPLLDLAPDTSRQAFETLLTSPLAQAEVIASEWAFTVPLQVSLALPSQPKTVKTVWLQGRVDRIASYQGKLVIIDWKTGTATPRDADTAWQTVVYLYALREAWQQLAETIGGKPPEASDLRFCYLEVKGQNLRETWINYSLDAHQRNRKRLLDTLSAMLTETYFTLPPRCPDRYCPFLYHCSILDK